MSARGTERPSPAGKTLAAALLWATVGVTSATANEAAASGAADDKSRYTLFNPTPDRLLRDLVTDRPDLTESPFTVDAGHIQFETNLFGYARSRPDASGAVTDTYEFGTTNIRIGLTSSSEFNIVWQPYGILRTHDPDTAAVTRNSGVGGLVLRGKVNFWGNDSFDKPGATAFGLLPYISLPTDRGNGISPDAVEGGVILPFAVKLTNAFDLGLNAGIELVHNDDDAGYHAEYLTSASLSYGWTEQFSTYYEVAARFGTHDPRGDVALLGTGFTYQLTKNLQFDGGINIGITKAADRINPFVGVSMRF